MQFKILAIPATGDHEAEEELNRFLRSHRAVSVQRELVQNDSGGFWCFCIEYLLGSPPSAEKGGGRRRVDYKEVLSEEDFGLFAQLRDVRKQVAASEAIPVYAVCTNEHLAEMAKARPTSPSDLKKIDGFGEAKAEKYGEILLRTIEMAAPRQSGGTDAPDGATD